MIITSARAFGLVPKALSTKRISPRTSFEKLKTGTLVSGLTIRTRAMVVQQKTGRLVQFAITADVRARKLFDIRTSTSKTPWNWQGIRRFVR